MKSGKKPPKSEKQTAHNVLPLSLNVPEKYKNCPPDLMWAVPLAMHQETPEFKAWMEPIEKRAKAKAEAGWQKDQKANLKLIRK